MLFGKYPPVEVRKDEFELATLVEFVKIKFYVEIEFNVTGAFYVKFFNISSTLLLIELFNV